MINNSLLVPTVLEQSPEGTRAYDLYSRLLRDRIIMLCDEVSDHSAQLIIGQMLYLEKKIFIFILTAPVEVYRQV